MTYSVEIFHTTQQAFNETLRAQSLNKHLQLSWLWLCRTQESRQRAEKKQKG